VWQWPFQPPLAVSTADIFGGRLVLPWSFGHWRASDLFRTESIVVTTPPNHAAANGGCASRLQAARRRAAVAELLSLGGIVRTTITVQSRVLI